MNSKRFFAVCISFLAIHCAQSKTEPEANAAPPPVTPAPPAVEVPAPAPEPAKAVEAAPAPPAEEVWRVKKGKLGWMPKPIQIGRFKNKKLPGYTTDVCFNYKDFSVVETTSTGEMGSAEIVIRYPSDQHKNICAPEFKGKYANLKIMEGHFAGVAGDYVVVDGDDKSEGIIEFQLFQVADGKEAFRARRNQDEELSITRKDGKSSVIFYGKLKVTCELALDGEPCWKKVLEQNGVTKPLTMPDCKKAFAAAKMELHELALVTARAQIADLSKPKVEFTGGKAVCAAAPP